MCIIQNLLIISVILERLCGCDSRHSTQPMSNIGRGTGEARSFPVNKTCWRTGFGPLATSTMGRKNKDKQNSYNFPFLRQELAWFLIFCLLFFRCCTILSKLLLKICLKVLASSQRCKLHQETPTYSPDESWSFTPRALFGCLPEVGSWSNDRKIATSKGIASASEPNELEQKFSSAEPRFRGLLGEVSGDAPSCQKEFAIRNPAEFQEKFCMSFCEQAVPRWSAPSPTCTLGRMVASRISFLPANLAQSGQNRSGHLLALPVFDTLYIGVYIYIYISVCVCVSQSLCNFRPWTPYEFQTNKYFHTRNLPVRSRAKAAPRPGPALLGSTRADSGLSWATLHQ